MRGIQRTIDHDSRTDEVSIVVISDVHLGNVQCNERALKRITGLLREHPDWYWVGLGDMCECITRKDDRFDDDCLPPWVSGVRDLPRQQRARLTEHFQGLGAQCLALVEGNHESKLLHYSDVDVYRAFAESIGAMDVCLGYSGFLRLSFRRGGAHSWPLTLYMEHGCGGGRSEAAAINELAKAAAKVEADVIVQGHIHHPVEKAVQYLVANAKGTPESVRHYWVNGGTFLGNATAAILPSYQEQKHYRPSAILTYRLIVTPDKHGLEIREV